MSTTDPLTSLQTLYLVQALDGSLYGPAPAFTVIEWARQGRISTDMLVAPNQTNAWRRADSYDFLASVFREPQNAALEALAQMSTPTQPPPRSPYSSAAAYTAPLPYHTPISGATNGMSIAALVCALIGLIICPIVFGVLGIVFGCIAHSQINSSGGLQRGKGMATAGIVVGAISIPLGCIVAGVMSAL